MLIEYHRTMLADRVRNEAFAAALKKLIKPGITTVADVGAGTGLLGFMAAKLGAKEVYLYESASIMGVARRLARDNKLKNIHFFEGHSTEALDAPKVDIVVSETLGNYAFEENIIATVEDAKRFLKPGGVILPQGLTQYVAPVIDNKFYDELTAPWENVGHGLDYSFAREMGLNKVGHNRLPQKKRQSAQRRS
jgi:protein arginine N-methyltransferase 1